MDRNNALLQRTGFYIAKVPKIDHPGLFFLPFAGVNSVRVMRIITERCSDVPMALTLTTTCYDLQITIPELNIQPSSNDAPWLLLLKCACQPTA